MPPRLTARWMAVLLLLVAALTPGRGALASDIHWANTGAGGPAPVATPPPSSEAPRVQAPPSAADEDLLGNHGRGVLAMRDQFPFALAHLNPFPETTRVLVPGKYRVGGMLDWSNTFGFRSGRHLIDGELVSLVLQGAWSPAQGLEVGAELPIAFRTGGIIDSFIEGFHDTFGYGTAGRDQFEKNTWQISIPNREGLRYESTDTDPVLENPVLKAKYQLTEGGDWAPAVAGQVLVKLPFATDDEVLGSNGLDGAFLLAASKRVWDGLFVHTNLWYGQFSDVGLEHLRFSRDRFSALFGLEYAVSSRVSILTHINYLTMIFQDLPTHLSSYTVLLTLGAKWQVSDGAELEFGLLENLYRYDNSADFGIHLGMGVGF
ncbi:MAG: DUF3187 family protein [Planctomycetes bacterium]|nr:DUF3187 family protein [Planctomycetota bacterium]